MVRRLAIPLLVALSCLVALVLTAAVALEGWSVQPFDAKVLHAFMALDGTRPSRLLPWYVKLADPVPYAAAGLLLAGIALRRRWLWRAGTVVALLVITGAVTRILKHVLAQPRFDPGLWDQMDDTAFPSGHATAAMTLALCAVLVAPVGWRLAAALAGGGFAAGMGVALTVLAHHFPSDVLGGYLVAGLGGSLAVALLRVVENEPAQATATRDLGRRVLLAGVAVLAGFAAAAVLALHIDAVAWYGVDRSSFAAVALVVASLAGALATAFARARTRRRSGAARSH